MNSRFHRIMKKHAPPLSALLVSALAVAVTGLVVPAVAQRPALARELSLEPDQAQATLAILSVRAVDQTVPESLWTRLEQAEGFRRVMERERGMDQRFGLDRGINEASFREWVLSSAALEHLEERRTALAAWEAVDVHRARQLALAYLPASTRLHGTIYPLVRQQDNSFIWDLHTPNPAIFMYVEPGKGAAQLQHTLAHELHHIGAAGTCTADPDDDGETGPRTREARAALRWISGFSEGMAVLAAAGGPYADTHPYDPPQIRDAWSARLDSIDHDIQELEGFFTDLLEGRLAGEDAGPRGMSFLNRPGAPQGPFYSVGWFMAATVEGAAGRDAVVAAVCDPVRLLLDYQEIATTRDPELPRWSAAFIEEIRPLARTP